MVIGKAYVQALFISLVLINSCLTDITVKNIEKKESESVVSFKSQDNENTAFIKSDSKGTIKIGYHNQDSIKLDKEQIVFNLDTNISNQNVKNSVILESEIDREKKVKGQDEIITKKFSAQKTWALWYLETFDEINNFWRDNNFSLISCSAFDESFLQHDCKSPMNEVFYENNDLPNHTELKINLNFHFIDKWEGQQAWLKVDDIYLWSETHTWCETEFYSTCAKQGLDTCLESYPDKMGVFLTFSIKHTGQQVKITVGTNIPKDKCDLHWGIDNVEILLR